MQTLPYQAKNKIRIVTAASLFDGHDAAINVMRRIIQSSGAEVIHLGHNRSAADIVNTAIQEDAQAIAITSYQGGHIEFFKYIFDLLNEQHCGHIMIFGGGGGTILPFEVEELHAYGIKKIFTPDDGRAMGLQGMINFLLETCDFDTLNGQSVDINQLKPMTYKQIAQLITMAENNNDALKTIISNKINTKTIPVIGISGTGGAGKSSVTDELVRRFLTNYTDKRIAVVSVDPSKKKTGGALLGDRIRMNAINHPRAYMRSMATRDNDKSLSKHVSDAIAICQLADYDLILLESSGIGQSDTSIVDFCDVPMYVMTPEYGAASQLEKIGMLDYAELICMNKMDKGGALDALHDVKKQFKRNHQLWETDDADIPVVGTMASKFNDEGMNSFFVMLVNATAKKTNCDWLKQNTDKPLQHSSIQTMIIPPQRNRYLAEITETITQYNEHAEAQVAIASKLYQLDGVKKMLQQD
jgi:methylmalonyl-CoA mutase